MHDRYRIQQYFFHFADHLIRKFPTDLNFHFYFKLNEFGLQINPSRGFDCRIYLTDDSIGTSVDHGNCNLTCDFEAGIKYTIKMTFNYFSDLLTRKVRLKRWYSKEGPVAWCVQQWDGKNWMNTQGDFPIDQKNMRSETIQNDIQILSEMHEQGMKFENIISLEMG